MTPMLDFAQLELHFVDQMQWRYALIRPLVLLAEGTPTQRAAETHTHPDTVRTFTRRFRAQGMLGLLPNDIAARPRGRAPRVPAAVRHEVDRLKALYAGFHYRELARILFYTLGSPIHHNTVKQLWEQSPVVAVQQLDLWDYHTHPDRYQARLQVIKLYYQGWDKVSISQFLRLSRPTVDRWITRFEAEHFAGLMDHKRAPRPRGSGGFPSWSRCITCKNVIPTPGSSASGVCSRVRTSPCARSVGLWPSTSRSMMTSPMGANPGPSQRPSPTPPRHVIRTRFGVLMAAGWIVPWRGSSGGA
jgi:hypothetical protein